MRTKLMFIFFLLGMGAFYPFVHNYIFFGNLKTLASFFFLLLWAVIVFFTKKKFKFPLPVFNRIIFIQSIFLFLSFVFLESSFLTLFYLILSWLTLFLIINSFSVYEFLKTFIKLNVLSAIFCLVGLILIPFGFIKIFGVYDYQDIFKIYNFGLFFVKLSSELTGIRPAGYYDEPGSFSFVVMFLLLINKKYFNNRKWESALLFLPLVTTSLAHLFTIVIYFFLFYANSKNLNKLFIFLSLIFGIYLVVMSGVLGKENTAFFRRKSVERIENLINGEDASRQGGLELGPKIFNKYPWGRSAEKVLKEYPDFVTETIWGPLIYYGIIGIPFYFLPFFYILRKAIITKNRIMFFSLLLVLVNLLQRPYYMYPLFMVLIYFLFFFEKKQILITSSE